MFFSVPSEISRHKIFLSIRAIGFSRIE